MFTAKSKCQNVSIRHFSRLQYSTTILANIYF